jgi:hypothetical protein
MSISAADVKMFVQHDLHSNTQNLSLCCTFLLRLPSVFCLSIHLPFSNLPADVTPLKLSSRQKAWETDQLVSGGTEQVLPLTEPTQTNADPGESREKGAQNVIRERDFSLFCCTFLPPLFKTLVPLFHIPLLSSSPLLSLSLFFCDRSTQKATFWYERKFLFEETYTSVFACTLARRQQQHQCGFWQQVSVLL